MTEGWRGKGDKVLDKTLGGVGAVHQPLQTKVHSLTSETVVVVVNATVEKWDDAVMADELRLNIGISWAGLTRSRLK